MASAGLPVVFLMGPTASGKTRLAIELVQRHGFEIISVDSAMIYQHMNIGTAKPTAQELQIAPHFLIDFLDPSQSYSVAQFRQDALKLIARIHARGHIPLLVGGTMLYHRALLYGLSQLPAANPAIRAKLQAQADQHGVSFLYAQLKKIDPISADKINPHDPQRIQRALEVYSLTGKPLSRLQQQSKQQPPEFPVIKVVIAPVSRMLLRERIAQRFHQMLQSGFVDEVFALKARGDLSLQLPAMRCVGYRQVWEYLDKQYDYDTMRERGITITRQFAKRQMTWLKKERDAVWLDSDDSQAADKVLAFL